MTANDRAVCIEDINKNYNCEQEGKTDYGKEDRYWESGF